MISCALLIQCDIFSHLQTFLLANALPPFSFHMNANASGDQLFSTYEGKGGEGVIETHTFAYKGKRNFSLMYFNFSFSLRNPSRSSCYSNKDKSCRRNFSLMWKCEYIYLKTILKFFTIIFWFKQRQKLLINIPKACFIFIWWMLPNFLLLLFLKNVAVPRPILDHCQGDSLTQC